MALRQLTELNRIFVATVVTTVFQVVGITTFYERMPGSYYIVGVFHSLS